MGKNRGLNSVLCAAAAVLALSVAGCMDGGPETKIQITRASYGYGAGQKNVTDDLKKACEGQSSCKLKVEPASFPIHEPADPSPGDDKILNVLY
jgi:hypothetical protein